MLMIIILLASMHPFVPTLLLLLILPIAHSSAPDPTYTYSATLQPPSQIKWFDMTPDSSKIIFYRYPPQPVAVYDTHSWRKVEALSPFTF